MLATIDVRFICFQPEYAYDFEDDRGRQVAGVRRNAFFYQPGAEKPLRLKFGDDSAAVEAFNLIARSATLGDAMQCVVDAKAGKLLDEGLFKSFVSAPVFAKGRAAA